MKPEYKIRSMTDFLSVPLDRIEECLKDFAVYLQMLRTAQQVEAQIHNDLGLPPESVRIDAGCFHWIDDGIRGISGLGFLTNDGKLIGRLPTSPSDVSSPPGRQP